MSYQVIARKWRSKSFDELIGQAHISQTLINALKNHRLPHALLFTGPRGTGKTSTARILAKSLRCPKAVDFQPCNQCEECLQISSGNSIDVVEIDGASNNGVDSVRELRESLGYMPTHGTHKVYIIDEVHMLSGSAFNALLKTLEEPPENVVFILATTEAHKIPNTILSRCQRFDFRRISTKLICDHLAKICKEEGYPAEEEALWIVARQGDGSMRDAQSLLDQVIAFSDGQMSMDRVVEVLGLTDRQMLLQTLKGLVQRDVPVILDVIQKLMMSSLDPKVFAHDLLDEIRNLMMIKMVSGAQQADVVDLSDAEIQHLKELSAEVGEEDIHLLFDMALKGGNDIPKAQDPRLVLEMLLLRMSAAPRIRSLKGLQLSEGAAGGVPPSSRPTQHQRPETNKVEPTRDVQAEEEVVRPEEAAPLATPQGQEPAFVWKNLVERIKKVNGVVAAKLEHTYAKEVGPDRIVLSIPAKMKFLKAQLDEDSFKNKIANYVQTFWGQKPSVYIGMEGESFFSEQGEDFSIDKLGDGDLNKSSLGEVLSRKPEKNLTPKELALQQAQEEEEKTLQAVQQNPLVKKTQEIFKAKIKNIKNI